MTTKTVNIYGGDMSMGTYCSNCSGVVYAYSSSSVVGRFELSISTMLSKLNLPSTATNVSYTIGVYGYADEYGMSNSSGCSTMLTSYTPTCTVRIQLVSSSSLYTILSTTTVSTAQSDYTSNSVSSSTLSSYTSIRVDASSNLSTCYGLCRFSYIKVVATYTDCTTTAVAQVLNGSNWSSSLTISKPTTVSLRGSISCPDSTCGSVSNANWAWYRGTTVLDSGDSGTSWSKSYTPDVAGTYYFKTAGKCGSNNGNATATVVLNSVSQSCKLKYDGNEYSVTSGYKYTASCPQDVTLTYNDSWGGYYTLYIGYKLHGDTEYTYVQNTGTSVTYDLGIERSTQVYDIIYCYGSSSSKTTLISFQVTIASAEEKGYYKINTASTYSEVSGGSTITAEVPTTSSSGFNVAFKYTNTYGSSTYKLRIYVGSTQVAESSTTEVSYTYAFTTNGNYTISYRYYYNNQEYTSISYTISIKGIIVNSNGRIQVDGTSIWTNITKDVAQYGEQLITLTGFTGLDLSGTRYVWSVTQVDGTALSSTDYSIDSTTIQSPTVIFKNTSINYRLTCVITYVDESEVSHSMHTITFGPDLTTYSTMGYVTCSGRTIAKIRYIYPSEGDTTTEFYVYGMAVKPTASGDVEISGVWSIKEGTRTLTAGTDYQVISQEDIPSPTGVTYNCKFGFQMNISGTFTVVLTTETVSSYTTGSDTTDFNVANVTIMEIPMESRHCVILYNDSYSCVLNRRNSNVLFDQLEFTSGLNKVGNASFNVIGGNNLTCGGTNASSLLTTGTKVIIVDNLCPIWCGVVTAVDPVNINFYNSVVNTTILKLTCEESLKELAYTYTSSGVYNGTVSDIINAIIPSTYRDSNSVTTSSVTYSMSFDVSSVLTAMDSLSNQVGWRYRCRPNVGNYGNTIAISGTTYTVSSYTGLEVGDYLIIFDGSANPSTEHPHAYNDGFYHVCKIASISGYVVTFTNYDSLPSDGTYKFSTLKNSSSHKGFIVDFKPAYYQDYVPLSVVVNDTAQNVQDVETASDKFGTISVYGVGNSGETISSTMKAWMTVNSDYTIPYSARISTSYDSTIDSISMTQQFKYTYLQTEYVYSEFTITLNGWSFPTDTELISSHKPTVFYKNGSTIRSMNLIHPISLGINRFTDQSGMNKTAVTCAYPVTYGDGTSIPTTSTYAYDSDGRLFADVISSLASQTNVVFNFIKVHSDTDIITDIIPYSSTTQADGLIRIGDQQVWCKSINASGELVFDWITANGLPHGHMTDVLVIDDTGTKYIPHGKKYSEETIDSPYHKYSTVKKTVQGAEGYSAMELERLACRYMQYGSNYSSRGSADIIYNVFKKSDYTIGCIRTPSVGDRIQFEKAESVSQGGTVTYNLTNFELVSYDIQLSKNMASVTFGMPFVEIGDVLYNMLSNSGMSIIPATNSTGT